jgi:YihY family inner membrane protein
MDLGHGYRAFDSYQRRHGWLGFPLAVQQKYSDDQGGYLAASIAYYAFFAIFPLLLVFVSALGFVLRGHRHLQRSIVDSALGQFPVVGHDLEVHSLSGNGPALALGIVGALWAGMGVFLAAENAMSHLWGVPHSRRPDFFRARGRALLLLVVLGGGVLSTTVLAGAATVGAGWGIAWKLAALGASIALDFGLFWVGFRLLTPGEVPWSCLRGGAVAAAVMYALLQALGGFYVGHVLKNATNVYGTFGVVIGLLSYVYLAGHITLLAAEGNVVATRKLWPRSFSLVFEQPATEADRRALAQRAAVEGRRQDQRIEVGFEDRP